MVMLDAHWPTAVAAHRYHRYLSNHNISSNSFSVIHLNIRSLPANLSSFLSYLDNLDHTFSVIGLTETWLNPSNVSSYCIDGYNHVYRTRCLSKGGGISLFVSKYFVSSEMVDLCLVNEYIESLFVKISNNNMSYVIGLVYRPPNSTLIKFIEILNDILAEISHMPCYIMGDYNIDLLKHECHPPTERFLDTMYSNSLLPMIFKPTRETETTATLIDNNLWSLYYISYIWQILSRIGRVPTDQIGKWAKNREIQGTNIADRLGITRLL